MRFAANEGDATRVLTDYRALLGMAKQAREVPFVVNELVGVGILSQADQSIIEICQSSPQIFAAIHDELLTVMATADPLTKLNIQAEHDVFRDMLQRTYSDNGNGDGSLTVDGMDGISGLETNYSKPGLPMMFLRSLGLPIANVALASRKELTEESDQFYSLVEEDGARPLWIQLRTPGKSELLIKSLRDSSRLNLYYALLVVLGPSLDHANQTFAQAKAVHEATMIAVALETYRAANGRHPATLADLIPQYYSTAPLDYSTGEPLLYKLTNGKPVLYGLGANGVDDGGVWTDNKKLWPRVPAKGDWVLYPPP